MVRIRLARHGAKNAPFFHIVVADQKSPRDGRFLKVLGSYNPCARGQERPIIMDLAAVDQWISQGAQCSDTVRNLIKKYRYEVKKQAAAV